MKADPTISQHTGGCSHCRAWLAAAEATGTHYRRSVEPQLLLAVRSRRALSWAIPWIPVAAAVVVAAVVLFQSPRDQSQASFAVKGEALTIYVEREGQAKAVVDGEVVAPGEALRFYVAPPTQRFVFIASVDGRGQISRLAPAGETPLKVEQPELLAGGAVLDSVSGPERVYAVMSERALSWAEIQASLHEALGEVRGDAKVRAAVDTKIPGALVSSVLLERGGP